ncbi:unnamed protein product [Dovyalis caffra]|uniref:Uncharacterized protein n=1 Tax=Dovyalis caffra TaxID=77055 RepID=A0AAV1SD15_9ROSI|nr:unnamed protein product [Dovyalis caffra]
MNLSILLYLDDTQHTQPQSKSTAQFPSSMASYSRYHGYKVSRSRSKTVSPRRRDRDYDSREKDYRDSDDHEDGRRNDKYGRDAGRKRHGSLKRSKSPVRGGREQRRARIEQQNKERKENWL